MVSRADAREWLDSLKIYANRRVITILLLGFSSGLPIMLIATTLSTWLREESVSRSEIGLFGFAFAPYAFKFIWAPLIDRMPLPPFTTLLGRRRGWMLFTQLWLIAVIWGLGQTDPGDGLFWVAVMAVAVGFWSASQDVVIDAYRIDSLPKSELGAGAGVVVLGYRIAMWVATAGALLIAAKAGWSMAYTAMALLMLVGIGTTLIAKEPEEYRNIEKLEIEARNRFLDSVGQSDYRHMVGLGGSLLAVAAIILFVEPISLAWSLWTGAHSSIETFWGSFLILGNALLVAFAVALGLMLFTRQDDAPWYAKTFAMASMGWLLCEAAVYGLFTDGAHVNELYAWVFMVVVWAVSDAVVGLFGFSIANETVVTTSWIFISGVWIKFLALVYLYAYFYFGKRAIANFGLIQVQDETRAHLAIRRGVVDPYADFFMRNGAYAALVILALISVFKASDAVLTLMANPFYIDVGFTKEQIAIVSKTFGLWMTLLGGLAGGVLVHRLGMMRSMVVAIIVMGVSNLMFALVATVGHDGLAITELAISEGRDLTEAEMAARAAVGLSIQPYFYALIIIENISGGIGTAIFVAFLSALCNRNFSATQYALVTSFMQMFAKFVIVPSSGFYADALGWSWFFITSTLFMVPAMILLWVLYQLGLEVDGEEPEDRAVQPAE